MKVIDRNIFLEKGPVLGEEPLTPSPLRRGSDRPWI